MAVIRTHSVVCDVQGCTGEGDRTGATALDVRKANPDWHVSGGKDICPECWYIGWRYGRDGWTCG